MVWGLAGKSCAGKNAVAEFLADRGWETLDMDRLSHDVLDRLAPEAAACFGKDILDGQGTVDRAVLGRIVFADPAELKKLEELIYPELHRHLDRLLEERNDSSPPLVINAAALEKSDFWKICGGILWVKAPWLLRLWRGWKRDRKSLIDMVRRFHAQRQLKPQHFFQRVDIYTIKNGGNRKRLEKRIERWLRALPPE